MEYKLPRNSKILEIGMGDPRIDHYVRLLYDSIQIGGSGTKSFNIPSPDARHLNLDSNCKVIMLNQSRGGTETILALARVHPYTLDELKTVVDYFHPKMAELFERNLEISPDSNENFLELGAIESIVKKEGNGAALLSHLQHVAPGIRGIFGEVESGMERNYSSKGFKRTNFREDNSRILMWTRSKN